MVAKSYQSLKQMGEPYSLNGKMYVKVQFNNGSLKQVRWYSESEYAKMYPNTQEYKVFKTQKEVLGFELGYITIFKGATFEHKDYFKTAGAKFNKWFGWFIPSTQEVPTDLPENIEAIRLDWAGVCGEDGVSLKNDDAVTAYVESLIYDADPSVYVGQIGDRINGAMTVEKVVELDGYYGLSYMHIFRDENENVFVWTTSTRKLVEEESYFITGTIKDHKTYRRTKQTILTRCKVE